MVTPLTRDDPRLRPSLLALPRLFWVLWTGQLLNRLGSFVMTFLPLYLTERQGVFPIVPTLSRTGGGEIVRAGSRADGGEIAVSYTHLRAHETDS